MWLLFFDLADCFQFELCRTVMNSFESVINKIVAFVIPAVVYFICE